MSERNPDTHRSESERFRGKNNPIENPVIFANVGGSLYWTPSQHERAVANLHAAAHHCGLSPLEYVEAVAPRPRRARG